MWLYCIYSKCKHCTVHYQPALQWKLFILYFQLPLAALSSTFKHKKTMGVSGKLTCNQKDRSCYDYRSSDALPPPWSYTLIAFGPPYKSRPQKTTDASDNDSHCWLSVRTEMFLLTFRKIMSQSVDSVPNLTQIYNPKSKQVKLEHYAFHAKSVSMSFKWQDPVESSYCWCLTM